MSDSELPKNVKIHKLPFVIKKNAITSYDKLKPNYDLLFRCVKNTKQNIFKEDIIYKSKEHDTFSGKFPNLIITNMLNVIKNTSRTVATYNENSSTIELNSDAVTRVIGQKNYDIVFGALCSVISQDLKVQGILSLLTLDKKINNVNTVVQSENKFSQTDETCREIFMRNKQRRHIRKKQIRSYAVDDDMLPAKQMKKVIIDPKNLNLIKTEKIKVESDEKSLEKNLEEESSNSNLNDESSENTQLPDLKLLLDEDSNISDTSVGNISIGSCNIPNILENPKSILNNIDKHTKETDISNLTAIKMIDGSLVMIRGNPDMFHLTSPDVLENLSSQDRKKILLHQAYIDWKFCLQTDCDGYLPLHLAVLNNDVDLLKRQCIVLKTRQQSVDILSAGKLTALQMSLLNDCAKCTVVLLQYGADPLIPDEEARTPLHLAAEVSSENVQALLDHCRANARAILKDNESLWEDNFERKSEKDLAEFLIYKMCVECDNQGYTPLMLASRIGNYESVKLLIQAAPETINMSMPNCGNTALYLAVSAACLDCHERGNKASVAEKFMNTVGALVENGADPAIDNNSGSNVNVLLTEFCISKLSMLLANKLTSAKYYDGEKIKNFDSYMLLKDADGKLNLKELKTPKEETKQQLNANNKINEEIKKVDSDKIEIKIIKSETNIEKNDKEHGKIQYTYGKTYGKRKTLILQDIPVVTNVGKRRPMILKKINTNSKITVSEPSIIKIDEQNLIPVKSLNTKIPIKLVKLLPKTDVKSSTTTTSTSTTSTSTNTNSTSNKRSISPSSSEHCSKKSKV